MTQQKLNDTLATLQKTLNETTDVDNKTRQLLVGITAEIGRLLDNESGFTVPENSQGESFSERLKDMIVEFEVHHPQIGGLLERLSDGLANMGI